MNFQDFEGFLFVTSVLYFAFDKYIIQWGTKAVLHSSHESKVQMFPNASSLQPPPISGIWPRLRNSEQMTQLWFCCVTGAWQLVEIQYVITADNLLIPSSWAHHAWQTTSTQFLSSSCVTIYFLSVPELIMPDKLLLLSSWAHHGGQATSTLLLPSSWAHNA